MMTMEAVSLSKFSPTLIHTYKNTHISFPTTNYPNSLIRQSNTNINPIRLTTIHHNRRSHHHCSSPLYAKGDKNDTVPEQGLQQQEEEEGESNSVGVQAALSMLNFYKREISPLMPKSCRYVPSCSEYSMIAYKKYGVVKGSVLTAWRLCRCNPLGGSGFDPPRWFDEERPSEE